ncbi:hypothetical protein Despr_0218 [Desulfobulbus propionicus DSM 2032]|uniref:Uncharacterized protein n=1 Tax=Desulfobulbus propionicus (strain ATCC 33891 / DSM 2032 / VKM B-1956 / 1pr3) TaxID=577650 RepID=A0A7U4DMX1_DESPD|nr:hypothetical protein Despr_0218 [Desulfobulbus propionicus DSM 2032]
MAGLIPNEVVGAVIEGGKTPKATREKLARAMGITEPMLH